MKRALMTTVALGIVAVFLVGMLAAPLCQGAVLAANKTEILFDGEKIHGLKGFTYKVYKDRQDVRGIGMNERLNQNYNDIMMEIPIEGEIVALAGSTLDTFLNFRYHLNEDFTVSIMQDSYPEGLGLKQFTFDGCHCDDREFQIDSHGYALTTYTFTADRLREA